VADDVYMDVGFNPQYVKEYRLIGFDNKIEAMKDSSSVIEGGEIGSGHSMVAMFEIVPTEENKDAVKNNITIEKFATVKLQYKLPNDTIQKKSSYTSDYKFTSFEKLDSFYRFSTAVAMFGSLLSSSSFAKNISWNDILLIAQQSSGKDDILQNEFIALVQQAKALYTKGKKKRNGKKNGSY
jgi:Ca-activated chloride channel family protein